MTFRKIEQSLEIPSIGVLPLTGGIFVTMPTNILRFELELSNLKTTVRADLIIRLIRGFTLYNGSYKWETTHKSGTLWSLWTDKNAGVRNAAMYMLGHTTRSQYGIGSTDATSSDVTLKVTRPAKNHAKLKWDVVGKGISKDPTDPTDITRATGSGFPVTAFPFDGILISPSAGSMEFEFANYEYSQV